MSDAKKELSKLRSLLIPWHRAWRRASEPVELPTEIGATLAELVARFPGNQAILREAVKVFILAQDRLTATTVQQQLVSLLDPDSQEFVIEKRKLENLSSGVPHLAPFFETLGLSPHSFVSLGGFLEHSESDLSTLSGTREWCRQMGTDWQEFEQKLDNAKLKNDLMILGAYHQYTEH